MIYDLSVSLNPMSRQTISLKCRVRYDGRSHTIDHRADLEKLPDPIWYTVGQVLRKNFRKVARGTRRSTLTPAGRQAPAYLGAGDR